jgi:uncharacterized protein (DUF1499 family)
LTILGLILLFGIAPVEGGLAADGGGNTEGRLKPCPRSPNCVSSLAGDERHAIPPLVYNGPLEDAGRALLGVLKTAPRVTLVVSEPDYVHAEFRSRVFGFVDDVEFFFQAGQRVIHVRSASRSGYFDFGVNRKRIEGIRRQLEAALPAKGDEK